MRAGGWPRMSRSFALPDALRPPEWGFAILNGASTSRMELRRPEWGFVLPEIDWQARTYGSDSPWGRTGHGIGQTPWRIELSLTVVRTF